MANECNADLDHPCNGGATESDPYRKCDDCRAEAEYWERYYGKLSRSQLKAMDPRNPKNIVDMYDKWEAGYNDQE